MTSTDRGADTVEEGPDRLFVIAGPRTGPTREFGLLDLVTSREVPGPDEQDEAARILRLCVTPQSVVEISAGLSLPVALIKIVLSRLTDRDQITVNAPHHASDAGSDSSDSGRNNRQLLERVLRGLRNTA